MKLLYATSITYPSYQTNRLQILQMSYEFQQLLQERFVLGAHDAIPLDDNKYIEIHNMGGSKKSFVLAFCYLLYTKGNAFTHIYCREEKLLFFMVLYNRFFFRLPLTFIYEAHHVLDRQLWWYKRMLRWVDKYIALTPYLKEELIEYGVEPFKIVVEPDGVDLGRFDIVDTKEDLRDRFDLPQDKNIILYTGLLYEWKGVDVLALASEFLSENEWIVFLGGKKHHADQFKKKYEHIKNIQIVSARPFEEVPLWLSSADVLVIPNSGKSDISKYYTSPLKLFEYMASHKPIVASNLPSLRQILNNQNSILVDPDDPKKLAKGILLALNDLRLAQDISEQSYRDVARYAWDVRVQNVVDFLM